MTENKYFALINDGFAVGFWQSAAYPDGLDDEGRPTHMPSEAVEISAADFDELYANGQTRRYVNGRVVPYDPPALPPEQQRKLDFPNLEPDQFWFVVRASGYEPDLLAWVASMNDPESPNYNPVNWAAASAKLEFAKFFERDHPFVEAAREAIGMSGAELDALWKFGAA